MFFCYKIVVPLNQVNRPLLFVGILYIDTWTIFCFFCCCKKVVYFHSLTNVSSSQTSQSVSWLLSCKLSIGKTSKEKKWSMFTTWHGNFQEHHRIVLWFWLNANMILWIEEKDNFDLKTRISKLNQNKNRATTFWKASLDSKWLLMRVTAASLKVNTSLAKLVSRQNFFLIRQVF